MQRAFSETTSFLAALRVVWVRALEQGACKEPSCSWTAFIVLTPLHLSKENCTRYSDIHTMILHVQGAEDSLRTLLQRSLH